MSRSLNAIRLVGHYWVFFAEQISLSIVCDDAVLRKLSRLRLSFLCKFGLCASCSDGVPLLLWSTLPDVLRKSIGIVEKVAGIGIAYSAPLVRSQGQLSFDLDPAPSSS